MTDNVLPMFSKGGKPALPPAEATALEPEFTTPEWETWWLPEPVGLWVDACHAAYGVPKVMAIAAALCAACTVTQGLASVEVKPGWREPLSLYWLVFSPTGSRKSALLKAATAPVRALQAARARELEPEIRANTAEKARLEQQIGRMRRTVKAHKWSEGHQQAMLELREMEHELDNLVVPLPPRWLYDDINPTMVPRKLKYSQDAEGVARVAVLDAEGTFLANLLGRHSGHVNVDPLLKGYNGEPIDMVRAVHGSKDTQDIHLDAAHLTLLLLVQPHYLDLIRAQAELGTNGLIGRCMMSHLGHSTEAISFRAPEVPQQVQDGYDRWIATLAAIEPGTVYVMPESVHPELEAMHDRFEQDRLSGKGAVGWTTRTLGRICRLVALTELGALGSLSNTVEPSRASGGGGGRTRVISKLTYLNNLLYIQPLETARALEPVSDPLARLTRRALAWIRQSKRSTVALRELVRGLKIKKDVALAVFDSLVESGHLEQLATVCRTNKTLTVSYRVLNTEPDVPEPNAPPFLAKLQGGIDSDDEGPPPDLSEYIGSGFEGDE